MGWILEVVGGMFASWTFICFLLGFAAIIRWPSMHPDFANYMFAFNTLLTGVLSGMLAILIAIWDMKR